MRQEIERTTNNFVKTIEKQTPDIVAIRRREMDINNLSRKILERSEKFDRENLSKFTDLGITELFQHIIDKEIVIQNSDLKNYLGVNSKAKYEYGRHYKKCSLLFDRHTGGHIGGSEYGHRITVMQPHNNGVNIHAFENGVTVDRKRIDFGDKNDVEKISEIASVVFEQIAILKGYKIERQDLEKLE